MRELSSMLAGLIGGAALLGASSAQATVTLLSIVNPPGQNNQEYVLGFSPSDTTTTISIAGYQEFAYEYVSHIRVTSNDGPNLLQTFWSSVAAGKGSDASMVKDGTSVRALWFGAFNEEFDTFSQTFVTIPGDDYWLKFDFTNNALASLGEKFNVSALEVTTSDVEVITPPVPTAIPEASTWLLMLLGFGGLRLLGYGFSLMPRLRLQRLAIFLI
jgi:hypothetical protein